MNTIVRSISRHCMIGMVVFAGTLASSATMLTIQPSPLTVSPGQTFSLNVGVTGAVDLFGYQFDLGFDPTILKVNGITEGPFLAGAGATLFIPGTITNTAGTLLATADSLTGLVPGRTGSGVLGSASFQALKAGSTMVSLTNPLLFDSGLVSIPSNTPNASISVSAVPEPSVAVLLFSGLLVLFASRKMRAKRHV